MPIRTTNTAHETTSRPPDVGTGNTSATSAKNTALFVPLLLVNELVALISGVRSFRWILVPITITFTIMAVDSYKTNVRGIRGPVGYTVQRKVFLEHIIQNDSQKSLNNVQIHF